MESSRCFAAFQISNRSFCKERTYLLQHIDIQPSEIDALPYYEWRWLIDDMKEILEEKQKAQEEGNDNSSNTNSMQRNMMQQQQRIMKDAQSNMMPKMPQMPQSFNF